MENQYTILLVDDEPQIRDILAIRFKRTGKNYNILEASSGQEAFEIWKNNKIDVVLSDVRMPNGSGLELFEKIKKESNTAKVILLTGFTDVDRQELLDKGVIDVFIKPVDINLIVEKIEQILNSFVIA